MNQQKNMKKLVRIDFDNIGDKIDFYLFSENFLKAQEISDIIKTTISESLLYIRSKFDDVNILLIGADDILFSSASVNSERLELLKLFFTEKSNLTVSIGVGSDIRETMLNLKEAKVSGKNTIKGV